MDLNSRPAASNDAFYITVSSSTSDAGVLARLSAAPLALAAAMGASTCCGRRTRGEGEHAILFPSPRSIELRQRLIRQSERGEARSRTSCQFWVFLIRRMAAKHQLKSHTKLFAIIGGYRCSHSCRAWQPARLAIARRYAE